MVDSLSKLERETLKSLYRLSRDGHDAHTGALAELLGASWPTLGEQVAHHIYVKKVPPHGGPISKGLPA